MEDYRVRPLIVCLFLSALAAPAQNLQQLTSLLRPNDLKADVSFLASDGLKGRATPSPGLDAAAEYIASEFRRAGLDPAGDNGYFQTAPYVNVTPVVEGTSVPGELRNVIGVLRGSDPVLRDTYIPVTAHYDHLGAAGSCRPAGERSYLQWRQRRRQWHGLRDRNRQSAILACLAAQTFHCVYDFLR